VPGSRLSLAIAAALLVAPVGAEQATISPGATVKQIHELMITPASNALFAVESEAPRDDVGWNHVRDSALLLGESAKLLMTRGRAKDAGDWMTLARALLGSARSAATAAAKRNVDALASVNGEIVATCEGCHETYRDNGRSMSR